MGNIKETILTIAFGFFSTIIFGMLLFGNNIFANHNSLLVIPIFGLYGSILYASKKYHNLKTHLLSILFVVLIVLAFRGKTSKPLFYLRDIYLLSSLYLAILLYYWFLSKYSSLPTFVKGFSLVAFFPILYGLFNFLLLILFYKIDINQLIISLRINVYYSIIISIGLSLGFSLFSKYKNAIIKLF